MKEHNHDKKCKTNNIKTGHALSLQLSPQLREHVVDGTDGAPAVKTRHALSQIALQKNSEENKETGHALSIPKGDKQGNEVDCTEAVKTGHVLSHEDLGERALSHKPQLQKYKADLHIHTVLSPCADLEMTPAAIVGKAKEAGLQIIGITDHNSTKNAKLVKRLAEKEGIFVLMGVEVTTKEEVHCLAFFEHEDQLDIFQKYLDENITKIPNPDGHFGYQPVVDENENIIEMVPYYLTSALKKGISAIQKYVYELDGIFIPAHINRPLNGIFSHLGFLPTKLKFDAMGITGNTSENHVRKHYVLDTKISLLYNSDAHFLAQIGDSYSVFNIDKINFREVKMALNQLNKRFVEIL